MVAVDHRWGITYHSTLLDGLAYYIQVVDGTGEEVQTLDAAYQTAKEKEVYKSKIAFHQSGARKLHLASLIRLLSERLLEDKRRTDAGVQIRR